MARNKITDRTWVPLGLAIIAIGGGGGWVSYATFRLEDHSSRFARIEMLTGEIHADVIRLKQTMGVTDGVNIDESENSEYVSSSVKEPDLASIRRHIHSSRTGNEGHIGTEIDVGTDGVIQPGT